MDECITFVPSFYHMTEVTASANGEIVYQPYEPIAAKPTLSAWRKRLSFDHSLQPIHLITQFSVGITVARLNLLIGFPRVLEIGGRTR